MKFGLIGYPIGHSLSPTLFKSAYPDLSYDLIEKENFNEALTIFKEDYKAVNVTAPFKTSAFLAADHTDATVSLIGAANILRKEEDGTISAFNTDFDAVRDILERHLSGKPHATVLVIGCGGAGRAAAAAASSLGMEVLMANRSTDKAVHFCKKIGNARAFALERIPDLMLSADAVIYTLPIAIQQCGLISSSDILKVEANYRNPSIGGTNYISGKEWLLVQAISGYQKMTGEKPDESRPELLINT